MKNQKQERTEGEKTSMGKEGICETERSVTTEDRKFPSKLKEIEQVPKILYYRGELPAENCPSVGIIGARNCTSYGRKMAEWFAADLALAGVQIISGLARGIDGISQKAALAAGGKSFGILGCGTDVIYPKENKELYELLIKQGGILSEYPGKTPPRAANFPRRNRIISGLSDALLVIEAREKSGTMITVEYALEQGKDVFVLPGRLDDELSMGCNKLARQGAMIALSAADILERLYGKGNLTEDPEKILRRVKGAQAKRFLEEKEAETRRKEISKSLSREERMIYECLEDRSMDMEELCLRLHKKMGEEVPGFSEVANHVMSMWAQNLIFTDNDGRYRRKK